MSEGPHTESDSILTETWGPGSVRVKIAHIPEIMGSAPLPCGCDPEAGHKCAEHR